MYYYFRSIVEIWGHVYFEYFATAARKIFPLKSVEEFGAFVTKHCEVIDAGEVQVDNNRKLWDLLAPYKNILKRLLKNL